jgi:hypothetical protein
VVVDTVYTVVMYSLLVFLFVVVDLADESQ